MSITRFDPPHIEVPSQCTPFAKPLSVATNCTGTVLHRLQGLGLYNQPTRSFLSVVVPARNEAANLPQLVAEIVHALRALRRNNRQLGERELHGFEIIIVDDCSTDATPYVLKHLEMLYSELGFLRLDCHMGQSASIVAGLRAAEGNWIATLDADLQNDPADLVKLWKAQAGYDVV